MGFIYLVRERVEIDRRRRERPGVLIEVWPDLHARDLFWLGDDETRRVAYASGRSERRPGDLFWVSETSKAALDAIGDPLAWDLAVQEAAVPIYYGPRLPGSESLPHDDSVRARVLSAHAIAAVWATDDRFGIRVEYQPSSPLDPTFYLRRPGGNTVHLFRALWTRTEARAVMTTLAPDDPRATDWAETLPAQDFADLIQQHASHPGR